MCMGIAPAITPTGFPYDIGIAMGIGVENGVARRYDDVAERVCELEWFFDLDLS